MPVAYSESVLKLGDSGQFSSKLRADMDGLTNKCMHSSMKSVNLHYHSDILYTHYIHNQPIVSIKQADMSERGLV